MLDESKEARLEEKQKLRAEAARYSQRKKGSNQRQIDGLADRFSEEKFSRNATMSASIAPCASNCASKAPCVSPSTSLTHPPCSNATLALSIAP